MKKAGSMASFLNHLNKDGDKNPISHRVITHFDLKDFEKSFLRGSFSTANATETVSFRTGRVVEDCVKTKSRATELFKAAAEEIKDTKKFFVNNIEFTASPTDGKSSRETSPYSPEVTKQDFLQFYREIINRAANKPFERQNENEAEVSDSDIEYPEEILLDNPENVRDEQQVVELYPYNEEKNEMQMEKEEPRRLPKRRGGTTNLVLQS